MGTSSKMFLNATDVGAGLFSYDHQFIFVFSTRFHRLKRGPTVLSIMNKTYWYA